MNNTPEYAAWKRMKQRCYSKTNPKYPSYGARGITVCDEWRRSFQAFYLAMGARPDGHSLDRIDNNKGYSPDNCRWATPTQQARNTRRNRMVVFNGNEMTMSEAAKLAGLDPYLIHLRIVRYGWGAEKALTTPSQMGSHSLKQRAKAAGISYQTVRSRIFQSGWSVKDALSIPVKHQGQ